MNVDTHVNSLSLTPAVLSLKTVVLGTAVAGTRATMRAVPWPPPGWQSHVHSLNNKEP